MPILNAPGLTRMMAFWRRHNILMKAIETLERFAMDLYQSSPDRGGGGEADGGGPAPRLHCLLLSLGPLRPAGTSPLPGRIGSIHI